MMKCKHRKNAKFVLSKTVLTKILFVITKVAVIIEFDLANIALNAMHLENTGFTFQLKLLVT